MTKKDLQEYYWVRKNIKQLEEKLLELETQAMKMTTRITHEINSSSGQQDKLGNIVAKIVELKDEINSKIEKSYSLIKKVEKARVSVKAVLGKAFITVGELMDLQVGDVIQLDTTIQSPVNIFVEDELKFYGKPGRTKKKMAVQITDLAEERDEYDE